MLNKAKAGDNVRVFRKNDDAVEGILMPRPEVLEEGFSVLKLDSGYNIGIEDSKIEKIEVLEEYKQKVEKRKELKVNKKLPTVAILSTGGTISSKIDYMTGGVSADYDASDFVAMCPELESIANIKAKKIAGIMSEDLSKKDWVDIAKKVSEELKDVDGVVVTMGTDTLHFMASALSFFLKDVNKPVIITGAQRSIDRGSSDAFMNLICSVRAAAKFDAAEVMTCLHGTTNDDYCILIRGSKVRKMHTSRRDAFRPINDLPLAKVFLEGKIEIINKDYLKRNELVTGYYPKVEEKVAIVQIFPGMDPEIIDFYVNKGYKGLVLSATALGHVPVHGEGSLMDVLKNAIDKGVVVVIASQTIYGKVNKYVYSNLRLLSIQLGCIFVEDIMPDTAYTKLCWALGNIKDVQKVKDIMNINVSGEINERLMPETFLY